MAEVKLPTPVPPEMKENVPAVKVKKKEPGIIDNFVQEEPSYVGQYLVKELVLPAVKNLIFDLGSNAMQLFLFGEVKQNSSSGNRARYSTTSSYNRVHVDDGPAPIRTMRKCSETTFVYPTRTDAQRKLYDLQDLLEDRGVVSVSNYLEMLGMDIGPNDNRYGWYNLDRAFVEQTRDGTVLNLPKPQRLDD